MHRVPGGHGAAEHNVRRCTTLGYTLAQTAEGLYLRVMPRYTDPNDTEIRARIPQWMHEGLVACSKAKGVSIATLLRWGIEDTLNKHLPESPSD